MKATTGGCFSYKLIHCRHVPEGKSGIDRVHSLAHSRSERVGRRVRANDDGSARGAPLPGEGLRPAEASAEIGHQVYPLIDTETSTEPVPVYKGSRTPEPASRMRWRLVALTLTALAAAVALYLVNR